MNDYEKIKTTYRAYKKILEVVADGDSKPSRMLRETLTVEHILNMERFINECEDFGMQRLKEKNHTIN